VGVSETLMGRDFFQDVGLGVRFEGYARVGKEGACGEKEKKNSFSKKMGPWGGR